MKPRFTLTLPVIRERSFYGKLILPFIVSFFLLPGFINAQCATGYNQVVLNWDNLDYFSYTGNYTNANGYLPSNAYTKTQTFAFGQQRLTIVHNYGDANELGENATHTGDANSYGIGSQDINFNGNGTITYTFDNEVQGFKLSIYDLDQSQTVTVSAVDASSTALPVILTKAVPLSLSMSVSLPGTAPTATATSTNTATTANTNTVNVDIAGPVKTITLKFNGTAGDFWLSNVTACSAGDFPNNYYAVSKPFTGQPGYVLHAFDKSVYAVNPLTGVTKLVFTDATGAGNINSMGYDPYNRILYYVYSLTGSAATNHTLKKYDFNTRTTSTVLADVNSIGIPTAATGVESGAAAFYNGALYLGIEVTNSNRNSGREAVVWRIDFNGSNVPYRACQVFAQPNDDGSSLLLHDWSDFVINDGVFYDFDGAFNSSKTYAMGCGIVTQQRDVYQVDMNTSATTNYHNSTYAPGQPTVDYNGNLYNMYAIAAGTCATVTSAYVAAYNPATGLQGTVFNLTSTPAFTPAIPSLGDAAEAFRPLVDYGDAPASYDPAANPAVHEVDTTVRLGTSGPNAYTTQISEEWVTKGQTVLANSDDDNALGAAPPLLNFNGTISYTVSGINVYNHSGTTATLIGWLDYNMNGKFDVGEGRVAATIPSLTTTQTFSLTWTGIYIPNTAATRTYLRLRLTTSTMTTADMNGWFDDGEVEDYPVVLGVNLPVVITSFDLQKGNNKTASLQWTTTGNINDISGFDIERSSDGLQWSKIGTLNSSNLQSSSSQYSYKDENALSGKSYYRVKVLSKDGLFKYTEGKSISFGYLKGKVLVTPNPVTDYINIQLSSEHNSILKISLYDYNGKVMYNKTVQVTEGDNNFRLSDVNSLVTGMYYVKLAIGDEVFTEKLIVQRN